MSDITKDLMVNLGFTVYHDSEPELYWEAHKSIRIDRMNYHSLTVYFDNGNTEVFLHGYLVPDTSADRLTDLVNILSLGVNQ